MVAVRITAAAFLLVSCSRKPPQDERDDGSLRKTCLITAGAISGTDVQLLKYGRFGVNAPLDCVVAASLADVESQGDEVLSSRLLVLRRQSQSWRVALDVAKWATNPEGYVGVDSIDDAYDFKGLRVVVDDKVPSGQPGITLWISYLDENGEDDGPAKQFSLNPATGRYQEFDDRQGFKFEIRDPPHMRSR